LLLANSVATQSKLFVESGSKFVGIVNGGGSGEIVFDAAGTAVMTNVVGFTTIGLKNGLSHTVTLTDANFTGNGPNLITVIGGDSGNTVIASALVSGRVALIGGAGTDAFRGGGNNDIFQFSAATLTSADSVVGNGGAGDELVMTTAGTVAATQVTGIEAFRLANGGANSLTLANANFFGTSGGFIRVYGGDSGNTVTASGVTVAGDELIAYGGAGTDKLAGGAGNDVFVFSVANLGASDTVAGGNGTDELLMTTGGTVLVTGVTGVEQVVLADNAANTLTLTNANFTSVTSSSIHVYGGAAGNTVTASALSAPNQLVFTGGANTDHVTGGAGNDIFRFAAADLSSNDVVAGGSGSDQLIMSTAGTINVAGITGVESISLTSTGANTMTLTNANFTSVTSTSIHVTAGSAGDTVNDAAVTGANTLVFTGGAGSDKIFLGAAIATVAGGAGSNQFTFANVGAHTISDFASGTSNRLIFRDSGFSLGVDEGLGTTTQQQLNSSLFVSNAGGTFTSTGQRFAYNTTNGTLSYDADGSGTTSTASAVVVLTGHPSLSASSLFFTS
jgi:Ca2+-binding RTX toxin-like protein